MMLDGPDVGDYIKKIKEDDQQEFREYYQAAVEEKDPEAFRGSVKQDLAQERNHKDLIRGVASGFHQDENAPGYESKFKFAAIDPLKHLESTPADVLLARTVHRDWIQLCVVACEVGDENVGEWTSNINKMHDVFEDGVAQDAVMENLGQGHKRLDGIQYVTLLPPDDFESVPFDAVERSVQPDTYAVWTCEIENGNNLCHEAGNLIHDELQETVEGCFPYDNENGNPISFTLETEPEIPLKKIAYEIVYDNKVITESEEPLEFNRSDFRERFAERTDLLCNEDMEERLIDERVDTLMDIGKDIGLISTSAVKGSKSYRWMYTGSDDPFKTEDAVKEKYIDKASEVYVEKVAFDQAKENVDYDLAQTDLGEFS